MSSYLNIYLVPKKKEGQEEQKPLLWNSYSRSTDIYQTFCEYSNVPFIGNGDTPNFSELTVEDISKISNSLREEIKKYQARVDREFEAAKKLGISDIEMINQVISEYGSSLEYLEEQKETLQEIMFIKDMVEEFEYSDFEPKILVNND